MPTKSATIAGKKVYFRTRVYKLEPGKAVNTASLSYEFPEGKGILYVTGGAKEETRFPGPFFAIIVGAGDLMGGIEKAIGDFESRAKLSGSLVTSPEEEKKVLDHSITNIVYMTLAQAYADIKS